MQLRHSLVSAATIVLAAILPLSSASAADAPKAAFIYVGPVGDAGWSYRHDQGRQCLEKDGIKTAFVETVPETPDVANVEREFLAQGFTAIFATAVGYQPVTRQGAKANPKAHFFGITRTIAPAGNSLE